MEQKQGPKNAWLSLDGPDGFMREKCAPVSLPLAGGDLAAAEKMLAYVDASYRGEAKKYGIRAGIGIAANQVGARLRMFYIRLDDEQGVERRVFLVNPKILALSPDKAYLGPGEGCLSVKGDRDGYVIRSAKIRVEGFDWLQSKQVTIEAENGLFAICLQHELDHLDGKLYYDRINPMNPTFARPEWLMIGRARKGGQASDETEE